MFKNVLIATDSSPATDAVVACAGELHRLGSTHALLAQCFMIPEHVAFPAEIEAHIKTSLEPFQSALRQKGFSTKIKIEPGLPSLEIPRMAEKEACSLIAIGSHGQNFSSEILLGGTASEIMHRTTLPLLIVRIHHEKKPEESCDFMRHVLFPTDFSNHAEYAFEYLLKIAKKGAKQITLLHAQDMSRLRGHLEHRLDEFDATDRQRLDDLKTRLNACSDASVSVSLCHGSPTEEILKQNLHASLIVMGTRGRGYINELFMGSVSHNTARHASVPVLLISKPFKNVKPMDQQGDVSV